MTLSPEAQPDHEFATCGFRDTDGWQKASHLPEPPGLQRSWPTRALTPHTSRISLDYSLSLQALRKRGKSGERGARAMKRSAVATLPPAPTWHSAMARKPSRS